LLRATKARSDTAGFTLIEVVVALAILAISLSSIGALIATTARGARAIEGNLTRLQTARAVMAALPDRDQLLPGEMAGEIADHRWRVNVSPFLFADVDPRQPTPWVAQTVVVTVRSPAGAPIEISTVRLRRRAGG